MEYFERYEGGEKTILVHLNITHLNDQTIWKNLNYWLDSAEGHKNKPNTQVRGPKPDAKYFVGTGKKRKKSELVQTI